jgi:hypothetical protein
MDYVVYLVRYSGNTLLPEFYIGSTNYSKYLNNYVGTVTSKEWKTLFLSEYAKDSNLFTSLILSFHETRDEALEGERLLHIEFDVVRSDLFINEAIASPKGCFGRDVKGELNPFKGKSHSLESRLRMSITQSKVQNLPENKLRNSINQLIAQNQSEVKDRKSKSMLLKYGDIEFKNIHLSSCRTENFRSKQRNFRLGKKWIHNLDSKLQKYIKEDELDLYFSSGWKLGMLPRTLNK